MGTIPQNPRTSAAAPAWPWRPSSQDGSLEVDPEVWAVDEIPSAESVASVRLEHGNDQSGVTMIVVPALPTVPALLAVPAAVTPPKAEPHQ